MGASPGSNIEQKNEKVPGNICRMSYSRLCFQHPLWLLAMASFSLDKIRTPLPFVWVLESCNFQDRGRDYPMKLVFIYTLEWVVLPLSTFYFNTYFNVAMTETREEIIPLPAYFPDSYYHCDHLRDALLRDWKGIFSKKTHLIRPKNWQETHLNKKRSDHLRCSDACI